MSRVAPASRRLSRRRPAASAWGKKPGCVAFQGSASTAGGTPAGQPARRRRYLGHLRPRCTLPRQGIFKGKKSLADLNSSSPPSRSDQWHAVTASFLGWTLDAFDFFVVVFLVDTLALHFHVTKAAIVWTMTATLAMRPVGAILFGLLADRYGRRKPLMANVVFFSVVELLCGFAPS